MSPTPSRRGWRLAATGAAIALVSLSGSCGTKNRTGDTRPGPAANPAPPGTNPVEVLRQLSLQQQRQPDDSARAYVIPGFDSESMAVLSPGETAPGSKAGLPLTEVINALAGSEPPPQPAQGGGDPEALARYIAGRSKLLSGQAAAAVTDLEAAARLDASSPSIWRELGEAQLALGRRASSTASFRKALELGSAESRVLAALGRDALRDRRYAEAAPLLARAMRAELAAPAAARQPAIAADFALAASELGYLAAARESLEGALKLPLRPIVQSRQALEAGEFYRRRGEMWMRAGDLAFRVGDFVHAAADYEQSAQFPAPDPGPLLARRAAAQLRTGRSADAALLLLDALEDTGAADRVAPLLGVVSKSTQAGPPLSAALLRLAGDQTRPLSERGRLSRQLAPVLPPSDARALLAEVLRARPTDDGIWAAYLARCESQPPKALVDAILPQLAARPLGASAAARAILTDGRIPAQANQLLASDQRPEAKLLRAALELEFDRADRALPLLIPVENDPPARRATVLALRVQACLDAAKPQECEQAWLQLAELAKSSPTPDVIQAAGWALLIQDRAADALALLRPLAESDAADESLLIQGAEAAARCGDFASTERYLQRVIQRDPGEEHAYEPLLGLYAAGAPLADESKLAATVRGLREAAPLGRTIRMATARELVNRSLWPQAQSQLLALQGDREDPEALALLTTVWVRSASATPELAASGEKFLRERLSSRPDSPILLTSLARVLAGTSRAEESVSLLAGAYERLPLPELARLRENILREALDRTDEADALAQARLKAAPRTPASLFELAEILVRRGELDEAVTRLGQDLPTDGHLRADEAARLVTLLARFRAETAAKLPREQASAASRLFDLLEARGATVPENMRAVRLALLTAAAFDDPARLATAADAVSSSRPMRNAAYALIASQLGQQADKSHAMNFLAEASRRMTPPEPFIIAEWFRLVVSFGTPDQAGAFINGFQEPEVPLKLLSEQYGDIIQIPDSPEHRRAELAYLIGTQMNTLRRMPEAEALYRKAMALRPDHPWNSNNLGYLLLDQGRNLDEAAKLIEAAYAQLPDEHSVTDSIGWLRYKQGRLDDETRPDGVVVPGCVTLLRKAIDLGGDGDATILDHLGDALWRRGAREEARVMWGRARESLRFDAERFKDEAVRQALGEPMIARLEEELKAVEAKLEALDKNLDPPVSPIPAQQP